MAAKLLDETALGPRPAPESPGGIARYRAEMPELEAGGQALTRAGAELGAEGDKLFIAYKHEQAKVDTLRAEDAYTQLRNEQLKMTYGPGGYATLKGQNAVLGTNIEQQDAAFQEKVKAIGANLANDDQKRLFQHRANIAGTEYKEGFLRHQLAQRNAWATDVTNNGVQGELEQIGAQYARPNFDPIAAANATSASLVRMRSLIASHADDLGLSEAGVDKAFVAATDKAITGKLLAWSSWDPVGAFDNFKAHQTELSDPAHRLQLRNTLWERALPVLAALEAQGAIDRARRDLPPPSAPSTGEETFQSVVGSLLKREGGYVAKDGKSGAPANFGINQRANPDIDVASLTKAGATEIYRKRYWNAIGGDDLAPATALVALDTAALQGPAVAKELLARTGGDPAAMIAARKEQLKALAARDPAQAPYLPQWLARLDSLGAEVAQMPGGGMQKVSAVERATYPNTSSLPTARNVAAQLPLALMQVQKRATELFGANVGDADRAAFVKRMEDEIRSRNVHDVQMVTAQQKEALQLVGNIVLGPIVTGGAPAAGGIIPVGGGAGGERRGMMKLTSFSELMANPQAAAAYQLLDFDGKRAVDTMLKTNANDSERGDPALFNEMRNRIGLPADDPRKINWMQTLNNDPRVQAGSLNTTQLNFLRAEIDRSATDDGRSQAAALKMGETLAKSMFQGNMVLTAAGTQKGNADFAQAIWAMNASKVVGEYKAANKDIRPLFDPTSKESLVSPQALNAVVAQASATLTPGAALAAGAAAVRAGAPAAAAVPPAQPKSEAEYNALPPGTMYIDPKGTQRQKPAGAPAAGPAAAGAESPEVIANRADGKRADGSDKGPGFLGPLPFKDGRTSTEITVGVNLGGKEMEIPTLVPALTKPEVDSLLKGERPSDAIVEKAMAHAKERIAAGKSVFAEAGDAPAKPAAPAAKAKDADALPAFRAQRGLSPEEQEQHVGGLIAAAKAVVKGALNLEPLGRLIAGTAADVVGAVLQHSKEYKQQETKAMFQHLLKKEDFTPDDLPVVRAAIKWGDLDPGDLKKAKAMLKAAGG